MRENKTKQGRENRDQEREKDSERIGTNWKMEMGRGGGRESLKDGGPEER